jgi:DNA-binding beta-propeller fold protein YncE
VLPPEFAYVTNDTDNTVSVFSVGDTGALTPITGSPFAGLGNGAVAASVTSDPAGKFLYTGNQGNGTLSAFSITPNGPDKGAPAVLGNIPSGSGGAFGTTVAPNGMFAYSAGGNKVSGFSIGPTGTLTAVTGSPFSSPPNVFGAQGIAAHPNGEFIYVTNGAAVPGTVTQLSLYTVNPDGTLNTPATLFGPPGTDPVNAPFAVTLDPLGKFAYTANNTLPGSGQGPGSVSVFTVDPKTGALTWQQNVAPIGIVGAGPAMVAVDPSGRFLYVAGGGEVTAFTIDPVNGKLTAILGSPFPAGLNTLWVAVDPNDKFVYVTDHGSFGSGATPGGVSAYRIDPATGALTQIVGSPFTLSKGPSAITVVAVP